MESRRKTVGTRAKKEYHLSCKVTREERPPGTTLASLKIPRWCLDSLHRVTSQPILNDLISGTASPIEILGFELWIHRLRRN